MNTNQSKVVNLEIPEALVPFIKKLVLEHIENDGVGDAKIAELYDMYISRFPVLSENTKKHYKQEFANFLKWLSSNHPEVTHVHQFTKAMAEEFVRFDYATKQSARFEIATLKRIWKEVFRMDDKFNPWNHGLHLYTHRKEKCQSHRPFSQRELNKILESVTNKITSMKKDGYHSKIEKELPIEFWEELVDVMVFAYYYGMRMGSIAHLKWADFKNFNQKKYFLHVPPKTAARNPRPLELPYIPQIVDILNKRRPQDLMKAYKSGASLFPLFAEKYNIAPSSLSSLFRRIVKKAKVKDTAMGIASFHSFRTSFVSSMDDVSAPIYITDSITGHKNKGMHSLYSKPSVRAKKKWILKARKTLPERLVATVA